MGLVFENSCSWENEKPLADLVGKTISAVIGGRIGDDEAIIETDDGYALKFYHLQDCCEHVSIADIDGDMSELVGGMVISAEEVSNADGPAPEYPDSYTWTFYKIETSNGGVTMRWLGESNGYYSESVNVIAGKRV